MSRWEHEVRIVRSGRISVRLVCRCGWRSDPEWTPTISRLGEIAREHRREASR